MSFRGTIRDITEQSVEHLASAPEFAGVTILARYKGAITDLIEAELARIGLYVFVHPVRPLKTWQNGTGLRFDEFAWRAEVGENPTLNATGLTAEYVAERIALQMLAWEPPAPLAAFFPAEDCIADAEDPELNAYFVNLRGAGGVDALYHP